MSRILLGVGFVAAAVLVFGGMHYYVWARLVRDPALHPWAARIAASFLVAAALSVPVAAAVARLAQKPWTAPWASWAWTWCAALFLFVAALAATDAVRALAAVFAWLAGLLGASPTPVDPGRRLLLARGVASLVGGAVTAATAAGIRSALGDVEVREVPVTLARLPRALSGMTIVQLTDLHVGAQARRRFVESVVEKTNALKPDVVVVTGDLIDGSVSALREDVEPLARLKSRYGSFFVTGNHEYYFGVRPWVAQLPRLGLRVLENERVSIGDDGASFDLTGVPDPTVMGFGGHPDVTAAVRGRDPERELILLAHRPSLIAAATAAGVGLQVSGHTHGGQFWPFSVLVGLTQPYLYGLHRRGDTQIYVSRGTGYWGAPVRILAPSEITKIVLT